MNKLMALTAAVALLWGATPAGALADEDDEIREGIEQQRRYAEIGRRIRQLEGELGGAKEWVQRAILLVELGDLDDRRAVPFLVDNLDHKHHHVVAFALNGINQLSPENARKGGGVELVNAVIKALKIKRVYHRRVAREILTKIAGEDLGPKGSAWKRWVRKNKDELTLEDAPPPFDESKYDPNKVDEVRRVMTGGGGGTSVRKRIPDMTSQIRELNEGGLDVVLCLDQTSSMTSVIEEAKSRIQVLIGAISEVVDDYRIGLVTYDDGVKVNVPLSNNTGPLREQLSKVQALGGGDIPEGVDKALEAAFTPQFGWRKKSKKTAVVLGDAPPHAEDLDDLDVLLERMKNEHELITNTVTTAPGARGAVRPLPEFDRIAEKGGGRSLSLAAPGQLVTEVLLLIFGEPMRPAMERFVPVLIEVLNEGNA